MFSMSCGYSDGDWGATVSDCDEICTVYYTAQRELKKEKELFDRNFPNKELRRKHVKQIKKGYRIESWFHDVNQNHDTIKYKFSCEVYYETEKINYVVKNLIIQSINE